MPRDIAITLGPRLDAQITSVGYLLRIFTPALVTPGVATLLLCDIGDLANDLGSWTGEDFTVSGAGTENVSVSIQNLNNAIGAFVLNASVLSDVEWELWQFERGDANNPVYLGDFRAAGAKLGIDRGEISLRPANLAYRFAPLKRITARDGFNFALRAGEILVWGTQRIIIQERK